MTSVAFHVDQLFSPTPGGVGTYIRELVPALAKTEDPPDISLFHARFDGRPPEDWMGAFPVTTLPYSIRRLYPSWNLLGRPLLPEVVTSRNILHAPSPAAIPPPGRGQRLVVTVHDLAFRRYPGLFPVAWRILYRTGTRRAARLADALIVPSEHTAKDLARFTGADPARIHVVPLAARLPDEADPEPSLVRLRVPRPYVLFVGTLEPRKNLVRLVRAYRRAVADARLPHALVLAGPLGWGARSLQRELAAPGPGRVVLTGRAGPAELDALYRGASVFCYPSLYEGFGLPVLEAMARGIPTIVSTTSSLPEVAGDAAVAVDPGSVRDLADGLRRVLEDKESSATLAAAGRARAGTFSWTRTASLTARVYEHVL